MSDEEPIELTEFENALIVRLDMIIDLLQTPPMNAGPVQQQLPTASAGPPQAKPGSYWGPGQFGPQWYTFSRKVGEDDKGEPVYRWTLPDDGQLQASSCRDCGEPIYWIMSLAPKYRFMKAVPINTDGQTHWATCTEMGSAVEAKNEAVKQVREDLGAAPPPEEKSEYPDNEVPF
jgi:hypothetical protein